VIPKELNARNIVVHAGHGSINAAKRLLDEVTDGRILIENMPKVGINDEKMIGYTPEQLKELMDNRFGLCLDFGHAVKAAISLRRPYKEFIEEFLMLEPKMFHISDGKLNNEKDDHLNIGEGDYDFAFLMRCVEEAKSKYVTLETPRMKLNSFEEDLRNLDELKQMTGIIKNPDYKSLLDRVSTLIEE
jgi:deoxyribonuclease-4